MVTNPLQYSCSFKRPERFMLSQVLTVVTKCVSDQSANHRNNEAQHRDEQLKSVCLNNDINSFGKAVLESDLCNFNDVMLCT